MNIGGSWVNPDQVDMITPREIFRGDSSIPDGTTVIKTSSGYLVTEASPEDVARWLFGRRACK